MDYKSELQQHVIEKFREKWPDARCPICDSSDWGVQAGAYLFPQRIKTRTGASSGNALPSAALVCQVCGNTQFINLVVLDPNFEWSAFF